MMGKSQRSQPKLFYHGFSLESRVPQEHVLRRVNRLVDFDFVRSQVAGLYGGNGNVSVDPAVILKLMFLLFFEDVKSERVLMEQLPLRLDWLWFCGYDLDEQTPNHSVISKARRRWGLAVFAEFFANVLGQCIGAGLVDGATVHVDSGMIDGNVSNGSLKPQLCVVGRQLYNQLEAQLQPEASEAVERDNDDQDSGSHERVLERCVSDTDPDARLASKYGHTTLGYKDHRVIDDKAGIVTATITTAANTNDGKVLVEAIEQHQANTGVKVDTAVADKAYGNIENYKYLREHGITPCIPHPNYRCKQDSDFTYDKFTYDADNDCFICPAGRQLHRCDHDRQYKNNSHIYRARRDVCEQCEFFKKCVFSKVSGRQIVRNANAEYAAWADGCITKTMRKRLMRRRGTKAEGSFADAANNHGFKRARWRGIVKMTIQNLMIAAAQNLRKLLRHLGGQWACEPLTAAQTCLAEPYPTANLILRCVRLFFEHLAAESTPSREHPAYFHHVFPSPLPTVV